MFCMGQSTSDLKLHFLACRYERQSSDKEFHVKYRIFKRSGRANFTLDFFKRLAANVVVIADHKGTPKPFQSDCLVTENKKSKTKC